LVHAAQGYALRLGASHGVGANAYDKEEFKPTTSKEAQKKLNDG
jgi:hypothetical protein